MSEEITSSEFRTAAKVLRYGMIKAQEQIKELPWYERIFCSAKTKEFKRLIYLCENEALSLDIKNSEW